MIHCKGCICFDCKNGYTKPEDMASYVYRKFKKSTGKRKNRDKVKEKIVEYWKAGKLLDEEFKNKL